MRKANSTHLGINSWNFQWFFLQTLSFHSNSDPFMAATVYGQQRLEDRRKVNTHEINDYKWIQMTFWQGSTGIYRPADPMICAYQFRGTANRSALIKGLNNWVNNLEGSMKDKTTAPNLRFLCNEIRSCPRGNTRGYMNILYQGVFVWICWSGIFPAKLLDSHRLQGLEIASGWSAIIAVISLIVLVSRSFQQ